LPTTEQLSEILLTPFEVKIPIDKEIFQTWTSNWEEIPKYFVIDEQENTFASDFSYSCMTATGLIVQGSESYQIPKYNRLMGYTWERLSQVYISIIIKYYFIHLT